LIRLWARSSKFFISKKNIISFFVSLLEFYLSFSRCWSALSLHHVPLYKFL
jgi:hypothetical protein